MKWIRDRNGNRMSFTYDEFSRVRTITDSLNRLVEIDYYNPPTVTYDSIRYTGFGPTQREIRVYKTNLSQILEQGYSIQTHDQLFPAPDEPYPIPFPDTTPFNPPLVSEVRLPDNRSYQFRYNSYGELARVILPTGGVIKYDWEAGPNTLTGGVLQGSQRPDYERAMAIYRRVKQRWVYPDGITLEGSTKYTAIEVGGSTVVTVDHLTADGQAPPQSSGKHYFNGNVSGSLVYGIGPYGESIPIEYPHWDEGREYKTEALNSSGTNLRRQINTWQTRTSETLWYGWQTGGGGFIDFSTDPRITETLTTLLDVSPNLVSKQTHIDPVSGSVGFDQYNNPTEVWEYDYGPGAPGNLLRHARTQYLTSGYDTVVGTPTNPNPAATIHIRSLPTSQAIYSDAGTANKMAETTYEYDNYTTPDGFHAQLVTRSNISGLCDGTPQNCPNGPNFASSGYTTRGNVTKVSRWLNTPSGTVNGYQQYDVAGNVVKAIDANGNAAIFDFSDRFGSPDDDARQNTPPTNPNWLNGQTTYAFPTKVTNALGHVAYTQYDYFLGRPVNSEDANGIVSSVAYNDALDRLTQGIQARYKVGSGVTSARSQTTFAYDDLNRRITTTSDRDVFNDNILTGKAYYDGLGRTWRKASYEGNTGGGNTWLITDTQFDALGRTWKVSNPFRMTSPDGTPGSWEWATTDYDALSRVTKVTTPDDAHVDTLYSGNQVTVTDQAGKMRRGETDALGRLAKVTEDPTGLNYDTTYLYDALGNLRKVTQGAQTRWFGYDSLSRLIRAKNPEQATNGSLPPYTDPVTGGSGWSMAYTYNANGNLLSKTDPLNVTTNYIYDAVNRNTQVAYSSYPNGSFYVDRFYDGATNGKGRFWYDIAYNYRWEKPTDNLAYHHNKVNSYDPLGRPLNQEQNFLVLEGSWQYKPFSLSRTYDLAGNVKTQTYPSGRVVNYGYDTAGRLNSFTGNLGGIPSVNYATGIQYNAYGLMSRETYGTQIPLYLNLHYNNRLQMVDLRLGSNPSDEYDWSRGALIFYYGTFARNMWNPLANSPDNNGNVLRQINYAPLAGGGFVVPQLDDYNYDSLNRITSVSEQQQSQGGQWTPVFTQAFSYDRWGNRTINVGATTAAVPGVTRKNFVIDTATNRMTSSDGCGMTYDAAGNQTYDCVGSHYYDSENRMTKAVQGGSNNYYFYDANGKRVRRILNGSQTWNGQETWFVYGFDGELVAEYSYNQVSAPLPGAPQKEYGYRGGKMLVVWDGSQAGDDALKWLVSDHLGSTRWEINKSGSLGGTRRHDYLPFGEELVASTGAQRSGVGYEPPASNVKQKFGSKERDTETGLDFFGARYYSSNQGRFVSVDQGEPELLDPQTWNRYQYARNNPLYYIDTDGNKDTPARNKYINDALATDPTLLEVIKKSVNFSQSAFEKAFIEGNGIIDPKSQAGKTLRGLAGEAAVLDGMPWNVLATSQPRILKGVLPDVGFLIPAISVQVQAPGGEVEFNQRGRLYDTVLDASGRTGYKDLSTDIKFGLAEVKTGGATNIRAGAVQVEATALALKLSRFPGVATLVVDKGEWGNLSATTRTNIYNRVTRAGGYIQVIDGLAAAAANRAQNMIDEANKRKQ